MVLTESRATARAVVEKIIDILAVIYRTSTGSLLVDGMAVWIFDEGDCKAVFGIWDACQKLVVDDNAEAERLVMEAKMSHHLVRAVETSIADFPRNQFATQRA